MKLTAYLERTGETRSAFAERAGVDGGAITRLIKKGYASQRTVRAVVAATRGAVTPNDIYDLSHVAPPAADAGPRAGEAA